MAKTSKLFPILAGILVVLIVGLTAAILHQRQEGEKARLKSRLELDGRKMEVITEKAQAVTSQMTELRQRMSEMEQRWSEAQALLYAPDEFSEIESAAGTAASSARMTLGKLEESEVKETEAYLEHQIDIRMVGPMRNIPAWAAAFFKQEHLVLIDRIAIVSPDYIFNKVRVKASVRYFEPRDPEQIIPGEFPLEQFQVKLDYLDSEADKSDPVYGQAMAVANSRAEELSGLTEELAEAARIEKRHEALSKLLVRLKELQDEMSLTQTTIQENIPTLYVRVRNSPMGSVALLISGDTARFPEISVDD